MSSKSSNFKNGSTLNINQKDAKLETGSLFTSSTFIFSQ